METVISGKPWRKPHLALSMQQSSNPVSEELDQFLTGERDARIMLVTLVQVVLVFHRI